MKWTKNILLFLVCFNFLSISTSHAESLSRSFAWPLKIEQLDPHNTSSDTLFALIAHYLAPLVAINADNQIVPALAKSWTVSKDGKTIILKLRHDAQWSDGVPITAQQAKLSIERALSGDMDSDAKPLLLSIKGALKRINGDKNAPLGIETPDKYTLVFHLSRNNPDFLRNLAFPIASPVPIHQITADNAYPSIGKLSSSGPYHLVETAPHSAKFVVNDRYYGETPHYKQVNFEFTEYKALIKSFLDESHDTLEFIPVDQMPWLKEHMANAIEISGNNGAFYLVFKHEELGGFKHPLRKLILESIDFARLNQVMTRQYFPTMSRLIPWKSIQPGNTPDSQQSSILQAKSLLKNMGYSANNPLKTCITLRKVTTNESLFNFLKAHLNNFYIHLIQEDTMSSNPLENSKDKKPKELCPMTINGYTSRIKSDEEIILSFLPGGLFHPYLKNQSELNQQYVSMSQLTDIEARQAAVIQLEDYLTSQYYAKALYKTDLISLVNKKRIGNYKQAKTHTFIPLTQYLKP